MFKKIGLLILVSVAAHANSGKTTSADTTNKGMPATGGSQVPNATMADSESARILLTINEGEITAAKEAKNRAQSAEVKAFATMMQTAHETNMSDTNALVGKQAIAPKESEMSRSLQNEAMQANKNIMAMKGKSFDKAYMDEQVMMHEKALKTLDDKLIPSAKNAQYKSHLQATRAAVEGHLIHARELRKKL